VVRSRESCSNLHSRNDSEDETEVGDGATHRGSNERGRGTCIDVAIVVLEEDFGELEDAENALRDGDNILLQLIVDDGNEQLRNSVELDLKLEGGESANCRFVNGDFVNKEG